MENRKGFINPTTPKLKKEIYKKWWFWLIIVFVALSAYGATLEPTTQPTQPPSSTGEPSTAPTNEQPSVLMAAEVITADVKNGLGTSVIGQRAYIDISKSKLATVSAEDFSEFVESRVSNQGYNYFSVVCDDGTGLFFPGAMKEIVEYGILGADGMVESNIGFAPIDANGKYIYSPSDVANAYTREEVSSIVTAAIPSDYQTDTWFSVDVLSQTDGTYSVMVQYDIGSNDTALAESSVQAIFDSCYPDLSKNAAVSSISFMVLNNGSMVSMINLPKA